MIFRRGQTWIVGIDLYAASKTRALELSVLRKWPVANPSILFPGRKFADAELGQIFLVALIDLVHRKILWTHYVVPFLHIVRIVLRVSNNRAALIHPNAELLR